MGENVKVSVIIPVYNAEKYLRQCLDSVVNQTLREIEIICVDDGSTDSSLSILREYEARDTRVKVLTQTNQYAGVARNNGMSAASGKYYIFWDADDFFEPDALALMYARSEEFQADICICGAANYSVATKKGIAADWVLRCPRTAEPFSRATVEDIFAVTSPAPWNKLFSAAFVQKWELTFQPLPRVNDLYFTLSALALAEKIVTADKPLIHYRVGQTTNLQSGIDRSPTAVCEALLAVRQKLEGSGCWDEVEWSFLNCALENIRHTLDHTEKGRQELLTALGQRYWREIGLLAHDGNYFKHKGLYQRIFSMTEKHFPAAPVYIKLGTAYANGTTPKVSVIIPVYNAELYLRECLDSVVGQTLKEIEIICVNDGSWDGSLQIIEEYVEKDNRITVISQRNAGPSTARNAALNIAMGQYVYMIDSDDLIEPNTLESLFERAERDSLDILFFDAKALYMNDCLKKTHANYDTYYRRKTAFQLETGAQLFSDLVGEKAHRASPVLQFVRREHLERHNIRFLDGIIHEDNLFTFLNIMQAERVALINEPYYIRRVRENSIMTRPTRFANTYGYLMCFAHMIAFAMEHTYDEEVTSAVRSLIGEMKRGVQRTYGQLSAEEKARTAELSTFERMWFDLAMENAGKTKNEKPISAQKTVSNEAALIRASWSYRIGRFITWPYRMVRGFFRCYREHGWSYTWRRVLVHLCPSKYVYLARKVVWCYRDHGFRYTWYKILEKLHLMKY